METVLNPGLYTRLKKRFGAVRVCNQGLAWQARRYTDPGTSQRRLSVIQSGEYYRVACFAGETLVVTPSGDKPIASLVGEAALLVPNVKGVGSWKNVLVRSFGRQRVVNVHLSRRRAKKVIRATLDHLWVVSGRIGLYSHKTTAELEPGDRLAMCFARKLASLRWCPNVSAVGVAQGFTFGDGSRPENTRGPASVCFFTRAKWLGLSSYFSSCRIVRYLQRGRQVPQAEDLPRGWKNLPSADESLSFLLGWLAGYFAADGRLTRSGSQAILYSANPENLNFVRGICYQLGIRVSPVRPVTRGSGGCVPDGVDNPMFSVGFPVRDVPIEFWVRAGHRRRVENWLENAASPQKIHWIVERVEDCGEEEEVYCAVVPGREMFTLADNILTHNCPFCSDTRFRLFINHMWGERDEWGRMAFFLAVCFNETSCLNDPENRDDFIGMVGGFGRADPGDMRILPGKVLTAEELAVSWPGACEPLTSLAPHHCAINYLENRGFDPATLERVYGVCWCRQSALRFARQRILFPFWEGQELVGWQARHPGELDWHGRHKGIPKYYTAPGMSRSQRLLGLDRACRWRTAVLVEGPFDAVRFGAMAMPVLGNRVSHRQEELLADNFRSGVLLLDPEEMEKPDSLVTVARLRERMGGRFCGVSLPEGTDPGGMGRAFLRDWVAEHAADQGVEVVWEKTS